MSVEIRTGTLLELSSDGNSAILELNGAENTFRVYKRMRREPKVINGQILPGTKRTRIGIPFVGGLEVAAWVRIAPGRIHILKFTSQMDYEAALAGLCE